MPRLDEPSATPQRRSPSSPAPKGRAICSSDVPHEILSAEGAHHSSPLTTRRMVRPFRAWEIMNGRWLHIGAPFGSRSEESRCTIALKPTWGRTIRLGTPGRNPWSRRGGGQPPTLRSTPRIGDIRPVLINLRSMSVNISAVRSNRDLLRFIKMVWPMTLEAWKFSGEPFEPRLRRDIVRLIRRER